MDIILTLACCLLLVPGLRMPGMTYCMTFGWLLSCCCCCCVCDVEKLKLLGGKWSVTRHKTPGKSTL